jgi:hypothetical protein
MEASMAIEKTKGNLIKGRRTREIYISTPHGQPYAITAYRDRYLKVDGEMYGEPTRDPAPIMASGNEIAQLTFKRADGTTFTGLQLLTDISAAIDQIDPENDTGLRARAPEVIIPATPIDKLPSPQK